MKRMASIEDIVQQTVKRVVLVVLGTGIIGNALYIYGLAYYEGYLERIGLDTLLFPVEWSEARLWTYFASRELGVSTVNIWVKFTGSFILIIMLVIYVTVRLWVAVNKSPKRHRPGSTKIRKLRRLVSLGRKFPLSYKFMKWLVIKEQAFFAFFASYFALIFMLFVPLILLVWVFFPNIGVSHGKHIGQKRLLYYEKSLCGDNGDYWDRCVSIDTSFLNKEGIPGFVRGRIIATSENLIGLMTEKGPVTMTMPPALYLFGSNNPCYKKGCEISKQKDADEASTIAKE